jgi:hypothetical protein
MLHILFEALKKYLRKAKAPRVFCSNEKTIFVEQTKIPFFELSYFYAIFCDT